MHSYYDESQKISNCKSNISNQDSFNSSIKGIDPKLELNGASCIVSLKTQLPIEQRAPRTAKRHKKSVTEATL